MSVLFLGSGRLPCMMHKQSTNPIIPRVWSDEVRAQAYDLWAGPANQNVSEAARQLTVILETPISPTTLHGWMVTERWRDRYAVAQLAAIPALMDEYVSAVWVAVPSAISTLSAMASGELLSSPERRAAAQFIVDKAQQLLLAQAKAKPTATNTSGVRLARIPESVDLASLNSTELEQLESQLREQGAGGTNATRTG
jgi:transposase-like protein